MQRLREQVKIAHRILYQQGMTYYGGHVSARVAGTDKIMINRLFISSQNLAPEDIIMTDLDGNLVEGTGRQPAEISLHCEIYKARNDVGSVIHTHQKWASAFGIAGRRILPLLSPGSSSIAKRDMPVYESSEPITTAEQGREVAKILGDNYCCHLQNNGVVVVATRVEEATVRAIKLERQAELNYMTLRLGTPTSIPSSVIEEYLEICKLWVSSTGEWKHGWDYYRSLV